MAWKRWNEEGSVALVLANLADEPAENVTIEDTADDGGWVDALSGDQFYMSQGRLTAPLGRSQVRILVRS